MKYPLSDHYDGKVFKNLDPAVRGSKTFWDVLKWRWTSRPKSWPQWVDNAHTPRIATEVEENEVVITHINHATSLIQFKGVNILTDPVFSNRVSPFAWLGPKRRRFPGVAFDALPRIDIVTISHNHYDHLDITTLKALDDQHAPLFIVPLNNAYLLKNAGIKTYMELDWWQEQPLLGGRIALVPAQHWSARWIYDRCRSLWGGYVYEFSGMTVYFAGDTGYNSHFKQIKEKYGVPDVSFLPIGTYEPRWFMKEQHMNPEEAVLAHKDLGSRLSLGIHFGTFHLSDEGIDDPVNLLEQALVQHKVGKDRFIAPGNGQTFSSRKY